MIIRAQPPSVFLVYHPWLVVVLGLFTLRAIPNLSICLVLRGNWPLQFVFPWFLRSLASS